MHGKRPPTYFVDQFTDVHHTTGAPKCRPSFAVQQGPGAPPPNQAQVFLMMQLKNSIRSYSNYNNEIILIFCLLSNSI